MSADPSIIRSGSFISSTHDISRLQRLGRRALLSQLSQLTQGVLVINEVGQSHRFASTQQRSELHATIDVLHPQFWADAAFGGTIGCGEAYMQGHWRCSDLTALVRIMVANRDVLNNVDSRWSFAMTPLRRALHWLNRNSLTGSRRNIAAHYDLGNDLFGLFLDDTMAYSCGIFERPDATMYEASIAKFDAICRKLSLSAQDHVIEVGTGWGGFAIYAAQHYGCRITTTTISKEQHALASKRVRAAGLEGRITLLLKDYRELTGQYDKLVSVEMVEAVGAPYLDTFFAKCSSLLKPEGSMLLQAITIQDQYYEQALKSVDFIQKFIFPGSFIPSITALTQAATRASDMKISRLDDIGPHYATTLRKWREAFFSELPRVKALGYPDSFIRMWEYYLCYCEGGYLERQLGDVHMLFVKPGNRDL